MPRIAGDSPGYHFALADAKGRATNHGFDLPSVTHIIKSVMAGASGGLSYWGFKLGIRSQHPKMSDEQIDALYERAKRGRWSPNKQRDTGGERGKSAHDYLDALAKAANPALQDRDGLGAEDVVPRSPVPLPSNGYEEGVYAWFVDRGLLEDPSRIVASELPVWHLRRGYAGQFDVLLRSDLPWGSPLDITDLKTHRPNRDGGGPAYETDLLQLAGYEGAILAMTPPAERPASLNHTVLLAAEDGSYVEDRRYIDPDVFFELVDVYMALAETGVIRERER